MDTPNKYDNVPSVRQVSSVAEFTEWVDELGGGNILFRGLANTKWSVESSLHRRLEYNKIKNVAHDIYHDIFVEMVKILISRSRRNGHDIEGGRELKDLELLANLQHYGAATCLIDFTKNSLVSLYFACAPIDNEDDNKANGKVVAFNSNNVDSYDEISITNFDKNIEHWFREYEQNEKLYILSPKKLSNRITDQQSVFVFGKPTLPAENFQMCEINNKKVIMKQLKKYGISEETLFNDFVGFSTQNSSNKEYENWDTDSYFMSGLIYDVAGDYDTAIKYYNNDINSNPESYKAYNNLGIIKNELGNYQEAISDYNKAISLNSKFYNAYNNRGLAKNNLGKFQEAISDYDEAIKLNPKDCNVYYNRGLAKNNLGKFQEAISDYDESIKLNPKFHKAYNNRGNAKDDLGKLQEAISDYDEAIKLNPKDCNAYYNRGIVKYNLYKFQEAINDYDEVIRLNPEHLLVHTNRGAAKMKLGKFQDAISDYDEGIRLNPKDWKIYNNRKIAKITLGDKEGAAVDFAKAKKLNPELDISDLPPDNSEK